MTLVAWVAGTILGLAAALAMTRLVRGPTVLDRAIALDVLLSTIIGAVAVEGAVNRHGTALPILAVLALLGFVGSVAVARFVGGETDAAEHGTAREGGTGAPRDAGGIGGTLATTDDHRRGDDR